MHANNPGTASPDSTQQASRDIGHQAWIKFFPGWVRRSGPDTGVGEISLSSRIFRAAGLSQARDMVHDQATHLICLPTDYLWESYSPNKGIVAEVKRSLIGKRWLSKEGEWNEFDGTKINKRGFVSWSEGDSEVEIFTFFSRLFNTVLECLRRSGHDTSVEEMVHVFPTEPESVRSRGIRPDGFLHMVTETTPTPGKFRWRDITCPFEYKDGYGDMFGVSKPGFIACRDRALIPHRTMSRRCGASTTSCAATPVGCSRLGPPCTGQSSVSGCCAERRPSRSPRLTGSRSVQRSYFGY